MEKTWVSIPDVLFFQEGPGVRNTQYTIEGVKLLNVANLVDGKIDLSTSDRYISEEEAYGKYKHFLCDAGDFIIASSGIKVEYIDKKMGFVDATMLPLCMNTSTIRFKVLDENQLKIRYFMYYLKSQNFKEQLFRQITGSAQLNYGPSHLKKMIMPLISLDKQDEIVSFMDKVQNIIDMRHQELVYLDNLIKARFVEMFGDPVSATRAEKVELSELCEKITDGEHGSVTRTSQGHPFLNAKHILKNGNIDWNTITFIGDAEHKKIYKRCNPEAGDILLTTTGTIGNVAIMPECEEVSMDRGITLLKLNHKKVTSEFVAEMLKQESVQIYMGANVHASAIGHLFMNKVKKIPVILPTMEKQMEFTGFVQAVTKSKF